MEPYWDTKLPTIFWCGNKDFAQLAGNWLIPGTCTHISVSPLLSLIQLAPALGSLQSAHATRMKQVMPGYGVTDEKEVDETGSIKRNKSLFMRVRAKVNSERYIVHTGHDFYWDVKGRPWFVYTAIIFFLFTYIHQFSSKTLLSTMSIRWAWFASRNHASPTTLIRACSKAWLEGGQWPSTWPSTSTLPSRRGVHWANSPNEVLSWEVGIQGK